MTSEAQRFTFVKSELLNLTNVKTIYYTHLSVP